jgi:hypothetical protein
MEDNINSIETQFEIFADNVSKFNEKGNASAGTRARKALLEISKISKDLRKQIQEKKNSLK